MFYGDMCIWFFSFGMKIHSLWVTEPWGEADLPTLVLPLPSSTAQGIRTQSKMRELKSFPSERILHTAPCPVYK